MPRPKYDQPTPGELEILRVLWEKSPQSGREIMQVLNRSRVRAYTSVTSLLNVMTDKGLLRRKLAGRGFVYGPKVSQEKTTGGLLADLLGRAFAGSASLLVAHLLEEANPTKEELAKIRSEIAHYECEQKGDQ